MTHDEHTRYIAVSKGNTQELCLIDALLALAEEKAEFVLVSHATKEGAVNMIKWTLDRQSP